MCLRAGFNGDMEWRSVPDCLVLSVKARTKMCTGCCDLAGKAFEEAAGKLYDVSKCPAGSGTYITAKAWEREGCSSRPGTTPLCKTATAANRGHCYFSAILSLKSISVARRCCRRKSGAYNLGKSAPVECKIKLIHNPYCNRV